MTLVDRTFRKDGTWQTLCLPFAVDDFAGTPLEGAWVMALGNSEACKTGFNAATGTLCYPWGEGMTSYSVNACSAYFQLLNGLTAGDAAADVRAFNLIFGDYEATGIISANPSGSMVNTSDAWYTISGMKLGTQPRQKGVYIYKGNKVVIK